MTSDKEIALNVLACNLTLELKELRDIGSSVLEPYCKGHLPQSIVVEEFWPILLKAFDGLGKDLRWDYKVNIVYEVPSPVPSKNLYVAEVTDISKVLGTYIEISLISASECFQIQKANEEL